jgi:glycosyltransferase involved in cell wall biosynthesis
VSKAAGNTILILSTEPWGKMLVSKMHYAIELAGKGNRVFFVNPPRKLSDKTLASVADEKEEGRLTVIDIGEVRGSLFLRHKLPFLYRLVNLRYARALKKLTGPKIDQVWCFNPNVFVDLRVFGAGINILLLYDFYRGAHIVRAARSADALVSISQVILDFYAATAPPKLLLQHGLGAAFANRAGERLAAGDLAVVGGPKVKIGYVGNLLRTGMNTVIAQKVIETNPGAEFHFWGPYSMNANNVTPPDSVIPAELTELVEFLQNSKNVILHGVADQQTLAAGLFGMDMFLFMYSPRKEMNSASNAHKLLEYLSTGKVVVSTYVSNYAGTGLMAMCEKDDEEDLPAIFARVVADLARYNSADEQRRRITFALDNTYVRQTDRILDFVRK